MFFWNIVYTILVCQYEHQLCFQDRRLSKNFTSAELALRVIFPYLHIFPMLDKQFIQLIYPYCIQLLCTHLQATFYACWTFDKFQEDLFFSSSLQRCLTGWSEKWLPAFRMKMSCSRRTSVALRMQAWLWNSPYLRVIQCGLSWMVGRPR